MNLISLPASVRRWQLDGEVRYAVVGDLDSENRDAFRAALHADLIAGERRFVVDLEACPAIDGRSISMLAELARVMLGPPYQARLTLENVSDDLACYLVRARISSVFEIRRAPAPTGA
jgi:anti-anti-sigma regulatory factor